LSARAGAVDPLPQRAQGLGTGCDQALVCRIRAVAVGEQRHQAVELNLAL